MPIRTIQDKVYPANARFVGFGEKAGSQLLKNNFTMTCFNYDNFKYGAGSPAVPTSGGPLNPSDPLYCSVPMMIETNPNPVNGAAYNYGIFFDNTAQSYFDMGADGDMFGRYYFGALYGDLDYYFIYGADVPAIIDQYTNLTGRPTFPPRYVFGFHQGAYGYYSKDILMQVAASYRSSGIPIDGLHIDVDFQDNYRTFTREIPIFNLLWVSGLATLFIVTGIWGVFR